MVRKETVIDSWKSVRQDTAQAVEDFPAAELDFKATADLMSFGERGRHILDLIGLSVTLFSCVFVGKIVLEYWQTWPSVNGIAFAGPLIALSLIYLCAIASVAQPIPI